MRLVDKAIVAADDPSLLDCPLAELFAMTRPILPVP